jgi:hypothetical protein
MGKEEPGDYHPIINEWEGGWVFLGQERAVHGPGESCP